MPVDVLGELGAVPVDPALVHGWLLRASAALWLCEASGKISGEYASRLRNGLASIAKFAPVATSSRPSAAAADDDDDGDDDAGEHPGGPRAERVDDPHTPIAR